MRRITRLTMGGRSASEVSSPVFFWPAPLLGLFGPAPGVLDFPHGALRHSPFVLFPTRPRFKGRAVLYSFIGCFLGVSLPCLLDASCQVAGPMPSYA